MLIKFGTRFS